MPYSRNVGTLFFINYRTFKNYFGRKLLKTVNSGFVQNIGVHVYTFLY